MTQQATVFLPLYDVRSRKIADVKSKSLALCFPQSLLWPGGTLLPPSVLVKLTKHSLVTLFQTQAVGPV